MKKFPVIIAAAATVGAIALSSCSYVEEARLSGTIETIGLQSPSGYYYTLEVEQASGAVLLLQCNAYSEIICAVLEKGDSISFVERNGDMVHVNRAAAG